MLESLQYRLKMLENIPPWRLRIKGRTLNTLSEGIGAPEPEEYEKWQIDIQNLRSEIAEEEARREIDRP